MDSSASSRVSAPWTYEARVASAFALVAVLLLAWFSELRGVSLVGVAALFAFVQWPLWLTKEVFVEDAGLRVCDLKREAVVPWADISAVGGLPLTRALVRVSFRAATPFGERVIFLAGLKGKRSAVETLKKRIPGAH
jgi:hypothetical protein